MNCNPKQAILQRALFPALQHAVYQLHTKVAQISKFRSKTNGASEFWNLGDFRRIFMQGHFAWIWEVACGRDTLTASRPYSYFLDKIILIILISFIKKSQKNFRRVQTDVGVQGGDVRWRRERWCPLHVSDGEMTLSRQKKERILLFCSRLFVTL